jgi:cobalamin biosynthesis protein CobD/CbiB
MLIVAYKINEILVKNYEKDQSKCNASILIGALLTFLTLCFTVLVYSYKDFNCAKNQILASITLILVIVITVLSVRKFREDASLLTASIATFYIFYC